MINKIKNLFKGEKTMQINNFTITSNADWLQMADRSEFNSQKVSTGLINKFGEITRLESTLADEELKIKRNEDLSDSGKLRQLAEFGEQALSAQLKKIESDWQAAERKEQSLEKDLDALDRLDGNDPQVSELQAREVRDMLRKLDQGAVLKKYEEAMQRGDMQLIKAVENAPKAFPVADPDVVAQLRKKRLSQDKNLAPMVQQLEDMQQLQKVYNAAHRSLAKRLEEAKKVKAASDR